MSGPYSRTASIMLIPTSVLNTVRIRPTAPTGVAALLLAAIAVRIFLFINVDVGSDPSLLHQPAAAPLPFRKVQDSDLALIGGLFGTPSVTQPVADSSSSLELRGTFVWGDEKSGMAILGPNKDHSLVYRVGSELPGGLVLAAIFSDHVVVSRAGVLETIRFVPRTPAGGAEPLVAAPQLVSSQANSILAGTARAVPARRAKGLAGYVVYPADDPTAFREMGLRSGDLIVAINGTRLDDPKVASSLVATLSWASGVAVTVKRGGREKELVIDAQAAASQAQQDRQIQELAASAKDPVMRAYRRSAAGPPPPPETDN